MKKKWRLSEIFLLITGIALLFFWFSVVSRPKQEWNEAFLPYRAIDARQLPSYLNTPEEREIVRLLHRIGWKACIREFTSDNTKQASELDATFGEIGSTRKEVIIESTAFAIGYDACRQRLVTCAKKYTDAELRSSLEPPSYGKELISLLFFMILFVTFLAARIGANFIAPRIS